MSQVSGGCNYRSLHWYWLSHRGRFGEVRSREVRSPAAGYEKSDVVFLSDFHSSLIQLGNSFAQWDAMVAGEYGTIVMAGRDVQKHQEAMEATRSG